MKTIQTLGVQMGYCSIKQKGQKMIIGTERHILTIAFPYLTYWTHFTDYQIGQFKTLAEYDYFVLGEGIETEGAPDFGLELDYPVKLVL